MERRDVRWLLGLLFVVVGWPALAWGQPAIGGMKTFKDVDFDTADTLDLVAESSVEYLCNTMDHTNNVDLYAYDGTNDKLVQSYTGTGLVQWYPGLRVGDSERWRVKAGTGAANDAYLRVTCSRQK